MSKKGVFRKETLKKFSQKTNKVPKKHETPINHFERFKKF